MSRRLMTILAGFALWIAIFALGLHQSRGLQYDNDNWLEADNPHQIARDMLADQFSQYEATMFLFKADNLFTQRGYQDAIAFADAAKKIDNVVDVVSVYDASLIMSDDTGTLLITTYREALEKGQLKDLAALEAKFKDSEFMGRLLSQDAKLGSFIVKQDTAGRPFDRQELVREIMALASENALLADSEIAGDGHLKYSVDESNKTELATILALAGFGNAVSL